MKKVIFLIQDTEMPSSRVRVINLIPELDKKGISSTIVKYPKGLVQKLKIILQCRNFDIILIQKKLISLPEVLALKLLNKKLIFDFDDAIYYRHDAHNKSIETKTRYIKFKHLVSNVDMVIAGNRILAEFATQFNKNVVIVPSAVEVRGVPMKNHEDNSNKVIIGWVGGNNNLVYLEYLAPVFQKLSKEYPVQLRILSGASISMPSVDVEFIQWKLETQEEEIARFDIGVMPLDDNKFTAGKCAYKALQYMASAVPPVVSNVGINGDIVINGKTGMVADSFDEFYDRLKKLVEDKILRKEIGLNGREEVEKNFSIPVVGNMLANILTRF